jgi:hypothetical protein
VGLGSDDAGGGQELLPLDKAELPIRRVWHDGRWFFSVVDVVGALTDAPTPRMYWADMKRYVTAEGFVELLEKVQQLKMKAADGKLRMTDAADSETLLRIIQSIPSPKAEPIKQWLARVGNERLEEMQDPAVGADRLRKQYERLGYASAWIDARLRGDVVRNELTDEWKDRGAQEGREFAILTDVLSRGTFDLTTAQHKAVKGIRSGNLRGNMTALELALTTLAEATAATLHQTRDTQGFIGLQTDAKDAGKVGGDARREIEALTQQPVVSPENAKQLRKGRQQELQPALSPLFVDNPAQSIPTAPPTDHENGD